MALHWKGATPHLTACVMIIWGTAKPCIDVEITGGFLTALFEEFQGLIKAARNLSSGGTCGEQVAVTALVDGNMVDAWVILDGAISALPAKLPIASHDSSRPEAMAFI